MATRNLARTVVEGGRARWNKYERRYSNRRARRGAREYARGLRYDVDEGEGTVVPLRQPIARSHHDRLAAAERWLASFVGRPWDEARAQIARRFDTRTIAGQHIVFDHLLPSVKGSGRDEVFARKDFEIDEDGILRYHRAGAQQVRTCASWPRARAAGAGRNIAETSAPYTGDDGQQG